MDYWDGSLISFVSPPPESSSSLLYKYNFDPFSVSEMKKPAVETDRGSVVGGSVDEKKKKKKTLSKKQLESLERSFEEEVKLDLERKTRLSQELGLQPRQIAVWFQNRRARWKTKQLQHLCCSLKQDFDTISREKHHLQQQVIKLRSMLREQGARNERLMAYTNVTGEGIMINVTGEETTMNITREETTMNITGEETTMESMSEGINWSGSSDYDVQDFDQISHSAPPLWWDAEQGRT